jgi:hypothetical protein
MPGLGFVIPPRPAIPTSLQWVCTCRCTSMGLDTGCRQACPFPAPPRQPHRHTHPPARRHPPSVCPRLPSQCNNVAAGGRETRHKTVITSTEAFTAATRVRTKKPPATDATPSPKPITSSPMPATSPKHATSPASKVGKTEMGEKGQTNKQEEPGLTNVR